MHQEAALHESIRRGGEQPKKEDQSTHDGTWHHDPSYLEAQTPESLASNLLLL